MKWDLVEPSCGDMIRVKSGSIYHYGVFISEDEVIQFGLAPIARMNVKDCDIKVCSSDIDTFLQGGFLEVAILDKKELKDRFDKAKTVDIARSSLGQSGYNIIYNNCEHFAYRCVFGKSHCSQTEDVRQMFRNIFKALPMLDVYTAKMPDDTVTDAMISTLPSQRVSDIFACSNIHLRRQKYYAWKLLEYAIKHSLNLDASSLAFEKKPNGKWVCPSCCFSISHSDDAVAVAVSKKSVGVDIQDLHTIASPEGFCKRILSKNETAELESLNASERNLFILTKWAEKESIFKSLDGDRFKPSTLTVSEHNVSSREIVLGDKRFILAVTGADADRIKFYHNIELGEKND